MIADISKSTARQAGMGVMYELDAIAMAVIGGVSLSGGRGSIVGSLAGVLLLSMMINALVTLRIEFFWQSVASGVVIIGSVAFYTWLQIKDRDGHGGFMANLRTPENRRQALFGLKIIAAVATLFVLGWAFAGEVSAIR